METSENIHIAQLQQENTRLQQESMTHLLVSNFTELLYGAKTESEILDILLYSLPEISSFTRILYYRVDRKRFSLQLHKAIGYEDAEKAPAKEIALDDCGENIINATFLHEQTVSENSETNSDRNSPLLCMRSYMILPFICRSTQSHHDEAVYSKYSKKDMRRAMLYRDENFPTAGLFFFDITHTSDEGMAQNFSHLGNFIHIAGIITENIKMMASLREMNESNLRELEQARVVQEGLLPKKLPLTSHISAAVHYTPADEVGGDYYDIFQLDSDHYALFIADVSGHGPSSALVMAMVKVLLRAHAHTDKNPAETLSTINEIIQDYMPANKFVTAFYGILSFRSNTLNWTSAGHCPMLLIERGEEEYKFQELPSQGFFIGMFPNLDIGEVKTPFEVGKNRLILYTDGITEAMNRDQNQYGLGRLAETAELFMGQSPQNCVPSIIKDLGRFTGDTPPDDDITLVAIDF